ncbi:MAG TPA: penicillin-binding protein 2 [Caulobacteraceae bacterium]|jgi:cell division protein FtsI (penicillin-binding protein 3)
MTAIPEDSEAIWRPAPGAGGFSWFWWLDRAFERARSTGKAEDDTRLRIFFVMVVFVAAFVTLGLAATHAALFSGLDANNRGAGLAPEARADLVDRNGQLLAVDIVRYGMYISPREVYDPAATKAALLSVLPTLSLAHLDTALTGPHKEYYVAGGIAPEVKDRLHDLALAGVTFAEEPAREYPLGATGVHVIGFTDKGGRGLAGIEKAMDTDIRDEAGHEPVPLSIDLRVQGALQDELEAAATHFGVKDAVGIVVNVHTGEVLGMASWPDDVNPNDPGKSSPASMVNHAAATVYEPGSVFKVFTLAMGLDAGTTRVDEVYDVHTPLILPGQIIHDYDKGDVNLPLWEVFTHSSNIGAARMALQSGAANMDHYWHAFGLYKKAPSELIESAHPLLPARLSLNSVATMAFGHSISVTPLMIATGMSSILNGGIYRPLTFKKLEPGDQPAQGRRVIKESTSRTMLNLMRLNAEIGTGRKANVPGYRVGGKTGTATKLVNGRYSNGKLNLASFAAIFPTDGPLDQDRYYVLIMMDEPKALPETGGFTTGGEVAAPIAGKVIARIAPFLNLHRIMTTVAVDPHAPVDTQALTGRD